MTETTDHEAGCRKVSSPGTAGGTLRVAGSWLSNDPVLYFNMSGTLGGKNVAVLVPEA